MLIAIIIKIFGMSFIAYPSFNSKLYFKYLEYVGSDFTRRYAKNKQKFP